MIPSFDKIHNRFRLNGVYYSHDTLKDVAYDYIKEGFPYQKSIGNFLMDWLNNEDTMVVSTSGSTGKPKLLAIKKQSMVHSALATGDYFGLTPGNKALHCLPTEFIAGKMMLVRALTLGLEIDLVEPNSQPLAFVRKSYDFCAMVPLQLQNSITSLNSIKTLIIGGANVSSKLQNNIQDAPCNIYATYGMTETVSHIAIKRLNNLISLDDIYKTLPGINVTKDERDCLVIEAPMLNDEVVITNDVVELSSNTTFKLLGRIDNVINSGGVKLFPEQIEESISHLIDKPFFITSKKDELLGERLLLVIEGQLDINLLETSIKNLSGLNKYQIPRDIVCTPQFVTTDSGKLQRKKTLELLNI